LQLRIRWGTLYEITKNHHKIFKHLTINNLKKKVLIIIAIIFGTIILIEFGYNLYKDWSLKKEINSYLDYYKQLVEECKSKGNQGCCMASVQTMMSGNYKLLPEVGCPDGYQANKLRCIDSYKWCEPIE